MDSSLLQDNHDEAESLTSPPSSGLTIHVGGEAAAPPSVKIDWSRYWPIPIAAFSYLVHIRYRRHVPRRLPTFTSMSLRELYGTGTCLAMTAIDVDRLAANLLRDKDLLTIELMALKVRYTWASNEDIHRAQISKLEELNIPDLFYTECAKGKPLSHQLQWFYNHAWSDIPTKTFAACANVPLSECVKRREVSCSDMDICVTHMANTCAIGFHTFCVAAAIPFWRALCWTTPIAMLARSVGPRILRISFNGIQRGLVYITAWLAVGQAHQHFKYPTTLEDKHGVAEVLRRSNPDLEKEVEDLSRQAAEGLVIIWPGLGD